MSRLSKIPRDLWAPELQAATRSEAGMMPILAHRPEFGVVVAGVYAALAEARTLDVKLLELVRLRIAFRNQCRTCMAIRYRDAIDAGLDEATLCALEKPIESGKFSPRELIAILYADRMATDHLSVDDAFTDRLREQFSEAEMVELGVNVAMLIGFGRLTASWHIVEHLPDDYRAETDAPFAPWSNDAMVLTR
jgi:alkylhydroperoxidase family enzyme